MRQIAPTSGVLAMPTSIQEETFYEGGPARGDLIFNLLLGLTLIGLPFAVGAIVRAVWLRFPRGPFWTRRPNAGDFPRRPPRAVRWRNCLSKRSNK